MEPYKPNKPWISVNLPTREELIAMAMGLIPGGRALKYYHDNPEGPISKTLDLATEDLVPFYANLIKPAVKGEDINLRNNLIEAALIGLPLNGPRGARRTDPKRVPIDEARTAEFNQKLNDFVNSPEFNNLDPQYKSALQHLNDIGNNPTPELAIPGGMDYLHTALNRAGLNEFTDDLIGYRKGRVSDGDIINIEEAYAKAPSINQETPLGQNRDYIELLRDDEPVNLNIARDKFNRFQERGSIPEEYRIDFDEALVDYYSPERWKYHQWVPNETRYRNKDFEFTTRRLNEHATDIPSQEYINQYINKYFKAGIEIDNEILNIIKSDLPKEEKRALIKDLTGEVILPIEIEELLL